MSKMKEIYTETVELAFECESGLTGDARTQALNNWDAHVKQIVTENGEEWLAFLGDIYDEIADRNGDAWDYLKESKYAELLVIARDDETADELNTKINEFEKRQLFTDRYAFVEQFQNWFITKGIELA